MANIDIRGPGDYKWYFHTSRGGNVWLEGKGKPIPLDQPLVNHVDSISPIEFWNSRCTRKKTFNPGTLPLERDAPTIALLTLEKIDSLCLDHQRS